MAKKDLKALRKAVVEDLLPHVKTIPKKNQDQTMHALKCFIALANSSMLYAQPYLITALSDIFNALGDKKSSNETKELATTAIQSITSKVSPNSLREVLPVLHVAVDYEQKWPVRVAGLLAIANFGDHAPEQLGFALPLVIPEVSQCIVDLKSEVSDAATKAMTAVCDVVGKFCYSIFENIFSINSTNFLLTIIRKSRY